MKKRTHLFVAILAPLLATMPAFAVEPTTVARAVEASMVRVLLEGPGGNAGASGFIISAEGHIATAYHVVQPYIDAGWHLYVAESGADPETRRPVLETHIFPEEDLAILRVAKSDRRPIVLSQSGPDALSKGMTVFAIGFPGAGERLGANGGTSFTVGVANRIFQGAWTPESNRIEIIQHSAATNPGNSGGPIVNPCGQVVGLNTQREMAMLITPTGMPIVYDVIQGVFFASHVSVLIDKLESLGIPYNGTTKVCRIILGVASTNFHWYGLAALATVLLLISLLVKHWPRRVVHVVVLGGSAARNGVRALGDTLLPLRWRHKNRDYTWRLGCDDAGNGPVDILITPDDLRRASKGIVIGSDDTCDWCVPSDGIAKRHARLVPLGDGLGVFDLHSQSGTTIDGRQLDADDGPSVLAPGSRLRLGNVTFDVEREPSR